MGRSDRSNNIFMASVSSRVLTSWANSRTLLTNGTVYTAEFFVLVLALVPPPLVENSNSVDGNGGLTSLTVTDDQLMLTTTNWNHWLLESAGECLYTC